MIGGALNDLLSIKISCGALTPFYSPARACAVCKDLIYYLEWYWSGKNRLQRNCLYLDSLIRIYNSRLTLNDQLKSWIPRFKPYIVLYILKRSSLHRTDISNDVLSCIDLNCFVQVDIPCFSCDGLGWSSIV